LVVYAAGAAVVAAAAAALEVEVLKSAGRVTPFSAAQVAGSRPCDSLVADFHKGPKYIHLGSSIHQSSRMSQMGKDLWNVRLYLVARFGFPYRLLDSSSLQHLD
jgi:hypothetical protein